MRMGTGRAVLLIGLIFLALVLLELASVSGQATTTRVPRGQKFKMRKLEKEILDFILNNSTYDSRIRPIALPNNTGTETQVKVNLLIRSVSRIDDFLMEYSVQLLLREEWYDDRLNYEDNRGIRAKDLPPYLTITDSKGIQSVWQPDTFIINEKEGHLHKILTPNEYIRIYPNGHVLYSVRMTLTLGCPMNLKFFPIDTQECMIGLASYGLTTEDLVFKWKEVEPIQVPNLTLPRFRLHAIQSREEDRKTNTGTYSTLYAKFILKRNFSYYMTNLYGPCFMLVIVSQINFYIDENAAPARTALGITTLLTMATQSASINRSLPPVSYTKAIDIWSGVCLLFVFAALMEYAFVNYYVRYDKRMKRLWQEENGHEPPPPDGCNWLAKRIPSRSKRIDVVSRIVFPLLFLVFNLLYWTICLTAEK